MAALITELIQKRDNAPTILDQIAGILALELDNQQALARAADLDPEPWALRVFVNRSEPWSEWVEAPEAGEPTRPIDVSPILNVRLSTSKADPSRSNSVERQCVTSSYLIDCYGYGSSTEDAIGHMSADQAAREAATDAATLARNILMAGHYTYLGLRGLVWKRWPSSLDWLEPPEGDHNLQHIAAVRFVLAVDHNEFSPQVTGQPLELITSQMERTPGGQVLVRTAKSFV